MENVVSSVFICRTWVCHVGSETSFVISCSVSVPENISVVSHRSRLQFCAEERTTTTTTEQFQRKKKRSEYEEVSIKTYWWFFSCCHILRQFFRLHNMYAFLSAVQFRLVGTFDGNQAEEEIFIFFYGFLTATTCRYTQCALFTNFPYTFFFGHFFSWNARNWYLSSLSVC